MMKILLIFLFILSSALQAEFVVDDIQIKGLQRISVGTVFNYLPLRPGEILDQKKAAQVIRALYQTGFFKDIILQKEGEDILEIVVLERPAIAQIDIEGNESIKTEQLKKGLQDIGLSEGRTFNRRVLDKIEQELKRQFYSEGKYAVKMETTVTPLERNRVAIKIVIQEGKTARIRGIQIIGNHLFDDQTLLSLFQSKVGSWLSWLTKDNQYSKQKLAADLEALKSFYLDRGYLNFSIESTQVSISPNRQDIYITINIKEGEVFTLKDIQITGQLILEPENYFPLIHLRRGEPFSRREIIDSTDRIINKLAELGYAFANVNQIPEIDEKNKTVSITFLIDPGKRVYVRRIEIKGNHRTRDRVIRREMRQMESAWLSNEKLKLSRQRIQRLGFFETVNIETPPVPGSNDLADVIVTVREKSSGSFNIGLGYSDIQGLTFTTSLTEDNFLGTGKKVTLAFNNSDYNTFYQLSYFNPYATINGVSRGFNLSYRETDYDELNISNYKTDISQASVNYGIPLSDFNRFQIGFAIENIDLTLGSLPPLEIVDFVDKYGDNYLDFRFFGFWKHDNRDSAIFPTVGTKQQLSFRFTTPGSDLQFYKIFYTYRHYVPLYRGFVFSMRADLAYGDGYGDTDDLPFFEHFYAGGQRSIRGFKTNTLGPKDSLGDPYGGNIKIIGNLELYTPAPFKELNDSVRLAFFLDGGNVFLNEVDWGEMRYSAGIGVVWLSPMGPMNLTYGIPINDRDGDDIENFQFSFSSAF